MATKTGLDALLTPERSALLLIDHQAFQFANLHSHEPTLIINNVVGLAKAAKAFKVPTILTTVTEERGGHLLKGIQDVFPTQKPINRTFINTWEDQRVIEAVKETGRKQLVIAALWTEICLAMPVIQSLADGYDVFFVTDASGGVSREAPRHGGSADGASRGRADHLDCGHERVAARLGTRSDDPDRRRDHRCSRWRLGCRVRVGATTAKLPPEITAMREST